MMRDFTNINRYLNILQDDVYAQPPDKGHTDMTGQVIYKWFRNLQGCLTVLDAGCGQGNSFPFFTELGMSVIGVTLGEDYDVCKEKGLPVYNSDFSFLEFPDGSFDAVFSRHSLEHSPMPLLTLMEWYRVAKDFLCLVLPNPDWFTWVGKNHYAVMHPNQAEFLLDRAGWHVIWSDFSEPQELRYMCEKKRISHYDKYVLEHPAEVEDEN
jgi:SAM-dependent methyltransferase